MKDKILKIIAESGKTKSSILTKKLRVSRQYLDRIIEELLVEKKIIKFGKTHNAEYVLYNSKNLVALQKSQSKFVKRLINKNLHEHEVFLSLREQISHLAKFPKNVHSIIEYAFTEILNNAIDHSRSNFITVLAGINSGSFFFEVMDQGVGIFNNIKIKKKLRNQEEALQDLLKGKQTTMPRKHTGEGIFFTSKLADKLVIESANLELIFDNKVKDIFIKNCRKRQGTLVRFKINQNSTLKISQIFRKYTGENYSFNKSEIKVKLYTLSDQYLSRSQAKRVMSSLDKFEIIVLDFAKVEIIGQGFTDEIFRVWQKDHPGITINFLHANRNIKFMIKRALVN